MPVLLGTELEREGAVPYREKTGTFYVFMLSFVLPETVNVLLNNNVYIVRGIG